MAGGALPLMGGGETGGGAEMADVTFRSSASAPVTTEQAWAVVCDTARYAEWVVATDAVTRTDGPARLGSTYTEINPMLGPWKARTNWVVVEFDPPHRQVHRTEDIPLSREVLVTMEVADAAGGCELSITLAASSARGPLGAALFAVLAGQTRRDNERTVANLATRVTALAGRTIGAGHGA
jgi:hypothetical protein